MANYTTNTSDKTKKAALIWWAIGAIGILGLEYFYVGKFKPGIIRTVIGIFTLVAFFTLLGRPEAMVFIVFWAIEAVPNLIRILLGTFKDNVGATLRQ